jgi:hypothetical protein
VELLRNAAALLFEEWNALPTPLRPPLVSATSAFDTLPYLNRRGEYLVVLGSVDDITPAHSIGKAGSQRRKSNMRRIPCAFDGCEERFDAASMRQHVGYHLLHDSKAVLRAPCGLCGVHPASHFGDETLGCSAWLEKKGPTLKPHHRCKVVGQIVYSHACAKKFTKGAPSTNHLIQCPECPPKPMMRYFWKYRCMRAHWEASHPSITMPASLVADLKITDAERDGLLKFKTPTTKSKAKKRRRNDAAAAPETAANVRRQTAAADAWAANRR